MSLCDAEIWIYSPVQQTTWIQCELIYHQESEDFWRLHRDNKLWFNGDSVDLPDIYNDPTNKAICRKITHSYRINWYQDKSTECSIKT